MSNSATDSHIEVAVATAEEVAATAEVLGRPPRSYRAFAEGDRHTMGRGLTPSRTTNWKVNND